MGYYFFCGKPEKINRWMSAKGFTGTLSNSVINYFKSKSGIQSNNLYDHLRKTLLDLGYIGTIPDQLNSFFENKTGILNRDDAERYFWDNDSLDFSSGAALGNNLLLEDASYILLESSDKISLES